MKVFSAAGLALIAACSPEPAAEPPAEAPAQSSPAVPTAPVSAPAGTASMPTGSALKGQVSGLAGAITDLRVRVTDTATIVELPTDVLFAFDSADLAGGAAAPLRRTAEIIAKAPQGDVLVVGHTDAKGEEDYNLDLSRRRAQAVAAWLSAEGAIPASRLRTNGRGEAEPVAPNEGAGGVDNPEGRALNRRVEVIIPR